MTTNKPKTNYAGDKNKVSAMDVCQTPPHALEPLYPHLPQDWVIWESAVGPEKILQTAFEQRGYTVIGTDLLYDQNYFDDSSQPLEYNVQITNMPFSIKYPWLAKAFERGKPFALLAPYETTFAKEFQVLSHEYHLNPWPIEVLSPERRINFKMPFMNWGIKVWDELKKKWVKKGDSAQMPTCWITWGLNVHYLRNPDFFTYYVPMRSVKYNDDNTEKVK